MERILVTGAFGTVGSAAVEELISLDWQVIACDLGTRAQQRAAEHYQASDLVGVRWCDLTDPDEVATTIADAAPDVVVHLASVVPPDCYLAPSAAHAVNVEGTRVLVRACEESPTPPRLVLASSTAVHGPRNPHAGLGLITAQTPLAPRDNYGRHNAAAEEIVRSSTLEWVILRLGEVLGPGMAAPGSDELRLHALLPADGHWHTVDVRDAARAFAAAALRDVVGETLLVGGDETHRRVRADLGEVLAAMGLEGAAPAGRPGDPGDDDAWGAADWMDTTSSQAALDFQRISWPDLVADIRVNAGLRRYALRLASPVLNAVISRRTAHDSAAGPYADVWTDVRAVWGPGALDGTPPS